jgi:hypothetical protein
MSQLCELTAEVRLFPFKTSQDITIHVEKQEKANMYPVKILIVNLQ